MSYYLCVYQYYKDLRYGLLDEAAAYRRRLRRYLDRFLARDRDYASVEFLDGSGRPVCRSQAASGLPPFTARDFSQAARLPAGGWRAFPEGEGGPQPILYFAGPARDKTGRLEGVLALGYDLTRLRRQLASVAVGQDGAVDLRLEDGSTLRGLPSREGWLSAEGALSSRPWTVVVTARPDEFLGPLRRVRRAAIALALAGLAALVGMLLFVLRSMVRPIAELGAAARRIGEGDLSQRVRLSGAEELETLARSFNEMALRLEDTRRETQRLQAQLVQSEKLSAIGQLISAVAHELNNPLAAVSSYVQLARLDGCPPQVKEDLKRVYDNVFRCRKVVDGLLIFARKSRSERKRVDLNLAAKAALELLDYRLAKTEGVRVVQELCPEAPDAMGDFHQVVQVLVNLIVNACDAMSSSTPAAGKVLVLRTGASAGAATVEVEDNGPGIATELSERVFEPFFTTKDPGHGTGLGLSICRQIARDHGGDVLLRSAPARGSVFVLSLPSAPACADAADEGIFWRTYKAVPARRVLVADDERDLADAMARLLREDGDDVLVAYHGGEAKRLLESGRFDLVVSDIEMEHVKGTELYALLAASGAFPACKILFVTGDILNPKVLGFLSRTGADYLAKPFDNEEFRQAARRLLAATGQPAAQEPESQAARQQP